MSAATTIRPRRVSRTRVRTGRACAVSGSATPARATPGRAAWPRVSRAPCGRAPPGRADPGRADPGRADPGRAVSGGIARETVACGGAVCVPLAFGGTSWPRAGAAPVAAGRAAFDGCGGGTTLRWRVRGPAVPCRGRDVAGPGRRSPAVTGCWPGVPAAGGRPRVAPARRFCSPAVITLILGPLCSNESSIALLFDQTIVRSNARTILLYSWRTTFFAARRTDV
jgi:hypothetical protein